MLQSDWSVCSCHTPTQGLQWCPLSEDEVIPRIRAMEGRRGRPPNTERQHAAGNSEGSSSRRRKGRPPNVGHTEFPSPSEAKLLRKLEAQGNSNTKPRPHKSYSQSERQSVPTQPYTNLPLLMLCFRNRPAGGADEADEEAGEAGTRTSGERGSQTARCCSNTGRGGNIGTLNII